MASILRIARDERLVTTRLLLAPVRDRLVESAQNAFTSNDELKERIRKSHPKYHHFSVRAMHKISTPPVEIPDLYRFAPTPMTLVGGRSVPLTRSMFMHCRRQHPHTLDRILEA